MKKFTRSFTKTFGVLSAVAGLSLGLAKQANAQVLFNESFTGGVAPSGWIATDVSSSGTNWTFDNPGGRTLSGGSPGFDADFAIFDSDNGCNTGEEGTLESTSFNASIAGTYQLEFDNSFRTYSGAGQEGHVEVWNGTTWTDVLSLLPGTNDGYPSANHKIVNITTAAGNSATAKVRFHSTNGACDWWWAIDNVKITRLNCISPEATFSVVPDCNNNQFSISVDVSSLGSAASVTVKEGATIYGTPLTAAGNIIAGPFVTGTTHSLTVEHNTNAGCNLESSALIYVCPATNDECNAAILLASSATCTPSVANTIDATPSSNVPSCATTQDGDVWFKFVATTTSEQITVDNVIASSADYYYFGVAGYSGQCGSLTELECSTGEQFFGEDPAVITLSGLTIGETVYLQVWEDDAYDSDFDPVATDLTFNICVTELPDPPSCVTNIAPADGALNVALSTVPPSFTWHSAAGATEYNFFLGSSPTDAVSLGSTADTTIVVTGLDYSTTYYWYIVPTGAGGDAVGCIANATSFTTEVAPPAPANDNCGAAANLTVYNGFPVNATVGTTAAATLDAGVPISSCAPNATEMNDVWYTVTVPATGNLIVQTSAMNPYADDYILNMYSGSCGALAEVACDDDGNPEDDGPSANHSRIELNGEVPGTVYYVRVRPFNIDKVGPFAISAWDESPTVQPPVSPGGNCIAANPVDINAGNGNLYRWVPIFDASGNIIAELYPDGNALGVVNSSVFVNTGAVRQSAGVYYLDRNVTITPTTQPSSDVKVRMYLLNAELSNLQAADPSVTDLSDLNFSKNSDPCQGAVNGATTEFEQTYSTTYGNSGDFIEFPTPSFSSIYARGGLTPLPIDLRTISATNTGSSNRVDWSTAKEDRGEYFELERSADGKQFAFLARIDGKGTASDYVYLDKAPVSGINYYRLKMSSNDSRNKYSKIVTATMTDKAAFAVSAVPNPVSHSVKVIIKGGIDGNSTLTLSDATGRVIRSIAVTQSEILIDMSGLAQGLYLIKYSDAIHTEVIKISKQ